MGIRNIRKSTKHATFLAILAGLVIASQTHAQRLDGRTGRVTRMAYPTGNPATSVILLERFNPVEVRVGEEFEYAITLTNLTNSSVDDVVLTEQLPAEFDVRHVDPKPAQTDRARVIWKVGALRPKGAVTFRIRGAPRRVGELPSCAEVTFRTGVCSAVSVVQPEIVLRKESPATVMICDPIPVRLTVSNRGSGVARDVRIVDQLPEGWTTPDGLRAVEIRAGDLATGQTRQFTLEVRAAQPGSFHNEATARDAGGLSVSAGSSTRVTRPLLLLEKSGPAERFVGRPAKFDFTVRNNGDAPAIDAVLVDSVPVELSFLGASDGGRLEGSSLTWRLGTIKPGGSRIVSATFKPNRRGIIENRAFVRSYCAEAATAARLVVRGIPAILLEVVDLDDPIEVNQNVTYEIRVFNQGSADGTNIVIACDLAPEQSLVGADGLTPSRAEGGRVVFAPLPSLAPKAQALFRVTVRGVRPGDVRFKVALTSDQLNRPVEETESTRQYE